MKKTLLVVSVILSQILTLSNVYSAQFDASVPPKGSLYFKLFPEVLVTSAKFDNSGVAISFPEDITALSHVNTNLELYYSLANSIMAGFLLPISYTRETYTTNKKIETMKWANPWFIIQHQFSPKIIYSASSIRIKIPLNEIEPIEEGFDVDDKQVDIYPIYYLDWQSSLGVYIYSQIGYKYRMKNDRIKPRNELKIAVETGYAIVPGIMRVFTCSDYIRFFKGKTDGNQIASGYIYNIGAGTRFMLGRSLRIEVMTKADPWGRNQFRGIGGHVGIGYVF